MKWLERWRRAATVPDGAATLLLLCMFAALAAGLTLVLVSAVAQHQIRESTTTERIAQATAAARAVRADLDRAVGYGIPLDEMRGVAEYLEARVAQQPELRYISVIGSLGQRIIHVGIDDERLEEVLKRMPASLDGDATLNSVSIGDYVVVFAPLHNGGGAVLVAVQSGEMTLALMQSLLFKWPFWAGCLLLVISWATTAVRVGMIEPVGRLASTMNEAVAHGCFSTLLIRRDRDAVGACLFFFNAVVAGLHAHRHDFVAQAEAVRHAVFDSAVAEQVEQLRDQTQQDLGAGLGTLPARYIDLRASDADFFAISLAAAGAMGLSLMLAVSASWMIIVALAVFGTASGAFAGHQFGNKRWATVPPAIAMLSIAVVAITHQSLLDGLAPFLAYVSGGAVGLAGGLALAQRRAAVADGGVNGGGWTVLLGGLSGLGLASSVIGDPLTTGVCLAPLAAAATIAAALPQRR